MTKAIGEGSRTALHAVPESVGARELFEVREELEQVRNQLRARLEGERTRELELAAARRDLEVKGAYNTMLERSVHDHQEQLSWAHRHIEHLQHRLDHELPAAQERARAAEQTSAEHAAALAQQRSRAVSRIADRLGVRLRRHRFVWAVCRRLGRGLAGR